MSDQVLMNAFDRLVEIMARLRGPGGCPWDREQTHESLREYLLEETCEVLEAIDLADDGKLAEELGDLLLQVVFHAQMASEDDRFDIAEVCDRINDKLISRHPHVFGDVDGVETADAVLPLWERQKQREAGYEARQSALDGIPVTLPTLARSYKLQRRAARAGFDWPDQDSRLDKVAEELKELAEAVAAGDQSAAEDEYGDLLFMVVNAGRGLGLQAEDALRRANAKFERRYRAAEDLAGGQSTFASLPLDDQDALWHQVKRGER